jgi:hypothetical protein
MCWHLRPANGSMYPLHVVSLLSTSPATCKLTHKSPGLILGWSTKVCRWHTTHAKHCFASTASNCQLGGRNVLTPDILANSPPKLATIRTNKWSASQSETSPSQCLHNILGSPSLPVLSVLLNAYYTEEVLVCCNVPSMASPSLPILWVVPESHADLLPTRVPDTTVPLQLQPYSHI